ncbi:MAG: helix-turn-helix domain-containing protein [Anaerolineales bacterium]|nr:helix-turn-helix domain-containing protein [Anaerolineales bacterium]
MNRRRNHRIKSRITFALGLTVRRCQILLKSAKWQTASQIAKALDCSDQTVREAIRAYHQEGLDCLREKSHARHDQQPTINEAGCGRLKEISRLSPRTFGFRPVCGPALYWPKCCPKKVTRANRLVRVPSPPP